MAHSRLIHKAVLTGYGTGSRPPLIEVQELAWPDVGPDEVLIAVEAAGVNPVDSKIASGLLAPLLPEPPFGLGYDVTGIVTHVGDRVGQFAAGDAVMGMVLFPGTGGTFATHVAVPAQQLAKRPATLNVISAAALPLVGLTAVQTLRDLGRVSGGQRVLIHGGAGGVGHIAIQFAQHLGANVTATGSPHNLSFLKSIGADEVVDHTVADFEAILAEVEPFDVVLNPVDGADLTNRSISLTRRGGVIIDIAHSGFDESTARRAGVHILPFAVTPSGTGMEELAALAGSGGIVTTIPVTRALHEVLTAINEATVPRHGRGKTVLTVEL